MCLKLCLSLVAATVMALFATLVAVTPMAHSAGLGHPIDPPIEASIESLINSLTDKPYMQWSIGQAVDDICIEHWPEADNLARIKSWNDDRALRDKVPLECTGQYTGLSDWTWLKDTPSQDFVVYEVTYDDCNQPFLFCWHKDVRNYSEWAALASPLLASSIQKTENH